MNGALNLFLAVSIAAAGSCTAATNKIGAWQTIIDGGNIQIAKTQNAAGLTAGVYCLVSSQSCNAYIITSVDCAEDAEYPVMINSNAGANTTKATCVTVAGVKVMVLDDMEMAISAFDGGGEVGFAIPMVSRQFSVARFDSKGSTAAIAKVRTMPKNNPRSKNPAAQVL